MAAVMGHDVIRINDPSRGSTSYSLVQDQLCENSIRPKLHVTDETCFKRAGQVTTTEDCRVTYGTAENSLDVVFRFFYPALNSSMALTVPKDSKDYKMDPVSCLQRQRPVSDTHLPQELFAQQKAPEIKELVMRQMKEVQGDPKDEWWHVLVEQREAAKKRKEDEDAFKMLSKEFKTYGSITKLAARLVRDSPVHEQNDLEDAHSPSSGNTITKRLNTKLALCPDPAGPEDQAMLLEIVRIKSKKKKRKPRSKKKSTVKNTMGAATTRNESEEQTLRPQDFPSRGEALSSEPSPFVFEFEKDAGKDELADEDKKVSDNKFALTIYTGDRSRYKGKNHQTGTRAMDHLEEHRDRGHDTSRDAIMSRLKSDAPPMSLEAARSKRATLKRERSSSIHFLRQRTISRESSVSGSLPSSPRNYSVSKKDLATLENVTEATKALERSPPSIALDRAVETSALAAASSADETGWQTVSNQKHKRHYSETISGERLRACQLIETTKERQLEDGAQSTRVGEAWLPRDGAATTSSPASQLEINQQGISRPESAAMLSDPISAFGVRHGCEEKLPSRGLQAKNDTASTNMSIHLEEQGCNDTQITTMNEIVDNLSDKSAITDESKRLKMVITAWQDQPDNEVESPTVPQMSLIDSSSHSDNTRARVFQNATSSVLQQPDNDTDVLNGGYSPDRQIFPGDSCMSAASNKVQRDRGTPPYLCRCRMADGSHTVINYDSSLNRLIIHPALNARPDLRNNPYHPDYLPPLSLRRRPASNVLDSWVPLQVTRRHGPLVPHDTRRVEAACLPVILAIFEEMLCAAVAYVRVRSTAIAYEC